jgi:alkanesulfonate monooxygenase SsuD/methylene tetrahydromethanopterin reductase-like flavin-dependent oxidoreductase (luciferase family)
MTKLKQVILGAQFPGVNNFTVWSDPAAGSQIEFSSFRHFAETVERGKFDFIFLAEGLRVREQKGKLHELDVAGRPNTLAILTALSAITENVGLIGTLTTTFNEPYALARQLATFDALSGGRAGWNVVTSPGAFTGANFRRGDHLPFNERYERAREFIDAAQKIWAGGDFAFKGKHFDIAGHSDLAPLPQGAPVIAQAGDSQEGRELAASHADVIYSRHGTLEAGQEFYRDVKQRLAHYGRSPDSLKICRVPISFWAIRRKMRKKSCAKSVSSRSARNLPLPFLSRSGTAIFQTMIRMDRFQNWSRMLHTSNWLSGAPIAMMTVLIRRVHGVSSLNVTSLVSVT